MSKHTPGPWTHEFVRTSLGIVHKIGPFPWKEGNKNHACLYGDYVSSGPLAKELEANARLMTAAPDMLEALELAAETFRRYEQSHRSKGTDDGLSKAIANQSLAIRMESIIAKARGEQ